MTVAAATLLLAAGAAVQESTCTFGSLTALAEAFGNTPKSIAFDDGAVVGVLVRQCDHEVPVADREQRDEFLEVAGLRLAAGVEHVVDAQGGQRNVADGEPERDLRLVYRVTDSAGAADSDRFTATVVPA